MACIYTGRTSLRRVVKYHTRKRELNFGAADRSWIMMPLDRYELQRQIARNVVGNRYRGWDGKIYRCDGYDPTQGFWMQCVDDPSIRRNVSERAIGSTFHICREQS